MKDLIAMACAVSAGCRGHLQQTSRGSGRQDPQHPVSLPFLQGDDSHDEGGAFDFPDIY